MTDVRNLDIEIEEAKQAVAAGEALVRLEKNRDFKKVITDGLLNDFALNTVKLRGNSGFRMNEALMASNLRKLDMIGELEEYFRNVKAKAAMCKEALTEAEDLRDELAGE